MRILAQGSKVDTVHIRQKPNFKPTRHNYWLRKGPKFGHRTNLAEDDICAICLLPILKTTSQRCMLLNKCNHYFCLHCLEYWIDSRINADPVKEISCPICRCPSEYAVPSDFALKDVERLYYIHEYMAQHQKLYAYWPQVVPMNWDESAYYFLLYDYIIIDI
ncbi:hypothetical protein GJ496_003241 [Pomphorhynchus laevis]|nr:hypothetical protein GJ496_003241 [Pomphorhynchus laevis]